MKQHTDTEIITLFKKKEQKEKAITLLVNKYQKAVYFHIRRMVIVHEDADDLTQETFVKIWNNLKDFKGEAKLFTWIYRIATNVALTFLNKKKRFMFLSFVDIETQLSDKISDDSFFNGDHIQLKLQKALLKLPQKQRLVFNMKYYDDMKYEDMSAILGTSEGALKASYHHAVKKIEKYLKAD